MAFTLLSLALLGAPSPADLTRRPAQAETLPAEGPAPAEALAGAKPAWVQDAERDNPEVGDCLDDDDSDETSSFTQRMKFFSRSVPKARAFSPSPHARLRQTGPRSEAACTPLIYSLCALLI
jgi:hypothetical protein